MRSREHRRDDRGWKLAAALLGITAFVIAAVAVNSAALDAPWSLGLAVPVIGFVLVAGTLWLVPARRSTTGSG